MAMGLSPNAAYREPRAAQRTSWVPCAGQGERVHKFEAGTMVITSDGIQAQRIFDGTSRRESVGRLGVVAELPTDRLELLRRADAIGFKLSIVMPAFNEARTIHEAIHAVLAVELSCNAELIVVDDGSTDDTERIVRRYGNPVLYVYQENQGVSAARNRASPNPVGPAS